MARNMAQIPINVAPTKTDGAINRSFFVHRSSGAGVCVGETEALGAADEGWEGTRVLRVSSETSDTILWIYSRSCFSSSPIVAPCETNTKGNAGEGRAGKGPLPKNIPFDTSSCSSNANHSERVQVNKARGHSLERFPEERQ